MTYQKALEEHGTQRKAAAALGMPQSTFHARLTKERQGLPEGPTKTRENDATASIIPDGYRVKGTSTMYDADGVPRMQWVKTDVDREQQKVIFEEMRKGFCEDIPRERISSYTEGSADPDLLTMHVITDAHIGMQSWREETGADYDLKIAEETIMSWFRKVMSMTPKSETAIFAQLGDFLHFSGMEAVTPASRHLLDADGRFQKIVRVAVRVLRRCIAMLLDKHKYVHVLLVCGNHDDSVSAMFKEVIPVFYENEQRITFDQSPSVYHAYQFGRVGLYFTHGHKARFGNVDTVMAAKFKSIFGNTDFGYLHSGHLHHRDVKETNLMIKEIHPTLAAPDAYAANGGWLSKRSASAITYHREYGEIVRHTIPVEMLK